MTSHYSSAEMMVVAMAREIADGELIAHGIGTTLPPCAYFLAKRTHAPRSVFLYAIGGTISEAHGPMSLTDTEALALSSPLRVAGYAEYVCDQLPGLTFKEFSRPAQVDRFGNTNNVVLGADTGRPLRFPGVGGIPDFSPYSTHLSYLYVPRQDAATLVEEVEFLSGFGAAPPPGRRVNDLPTSGRGTRRLVTDLAVFEFSSEGATVVSIHPGISADTVRERCGFTPILQDEVPETVPPTPEELRLIREEIDPRGIRDLELLPGRERTARIRVLAREERGRREPRVGAST